jgi:ABC-type multidrug transport system fused ATPase/permease subunit
MIYNKGLNLSSFTISGGKMDSGQIVNHISTDTQNISMSMTFLHHLWGAPLKLILAFILIVNELGVAALLGFVVLLVLIIPINYVLAAKMGRFQKIGLGTVLYKNYCFLFFQYFTSKKAFLLAKREVW